MSLFEKVMSITVKNDLRLFLPLLSSLLTLSIITLLLTIKLPPPQQTNERNMRAQMCKCKIGGRRISGLVPSLSA